MTQSSRFRPVFLFFALLYSFAFFFFYYKYVPLVVPLQIVLIPILLVTLIVSAINLSWGIFWLVFSFPLINSLPYFFGIQGHIPHAPTVLVLFLAFFLGWLINQSHSYSHFSINHPVFRPLILCSLIIIISGIITFFRYADFFPFLSDDIRELVVNINGVRAGGAIMSDIFSCLNYLTGFLFFVILSNTIKSKDFIKKLLIVLSGAILISLLFSFVQKYHSQGLGNTSFWVKLDRINSTFKDPNSFGVILSSFLPLLLGMVLSFRKNFRLFFLLLIAFGLFIFPSIGSRSGLLGLGVSIVTFFLLYFLSLDLSFKRKFIYVLSIFLIIVLIFFSLYIFSKQTNLYKRIGWSIDVVANKESLNKLFTRKLDFWGAANNMIIGYPLTGVGIGAFIIELPNYLNQMGKPFRYTDSTENYFFQVSSELGLIGLILIFWFFLEVFKIIRKSWKKIPSDNKDKFILIGLISGLVSMFVNFFFHSYIGAFDVKYFFWFLITSVFIFSKENGIPAVNSHPNHKFRFIAFTVLLTFGAVHLWNSTHALSLADETEKYGWNQNFGFYQQEKDERGIYYRWAKKQAGISVENVGPILHIPMMASHPDIDKNPVSVRIYTANPHFKKDRLIKKITFHKSEWIDFEYSIQRIPEKKIYLVFETNRAWQPLKYLGIPDPRWITIALGDAWFEYSDEFMEEMIESIQTVSQKNWEGKSQEKLWANGVASIKFNVKPKNIALRLQIKGQKAFELGPHIIVRIDNQVIGRYLLTENKWTSLVFSPEITEGEHILSVEFINDFNNLELGQDRNVFLGDLEVIYIK